MMKTQFAICHPQFLAARATRPRRHFLTLTGEPSQVIIEAGREKRKANSE